MKNLFRLTMLFAMLFGLSACGSRETWDYVVMGVHIRSKVSYTGDQYATALREDNNVEVIVHEQERWEPREIHEHLRADDELRLAIQDAEVIIFDFAFDWLDDASRLYLDGNCGGDDGQECLRESVQIARDDWVGIMDQLIEIRAGTPVILRVVIHGDWFYNWYNWDRYWSATSPEEKQTLNNYYLEGQSFVQEDAARRGVVIVRAFPEPYFNEGNPPREYLLSNGIHLSEQDSQVIVEEMRKPGYEFAVLK